MQHVKSAESPRNMCIAHFSIVTEEYHSDNDFRTIFKLLHYCSINLNCCVKTCEYFILTIKENVKWTIMKNLKKTAFYRIMFLFHSYLSISNGANYARGGDFVSFFRPGFRSFALKSCPSGGDFDGKN